MKNTIEASRILWHYYYRNELPGMLRRETAMDSLENIIYSLIPLILILVLSWLFGSFGSKTRKQEGERQKPSSPLPGEQLLDLISSKRGEKELLPEGAGAKLPNEIAHEDTDDWNRLRSGAPGVVTPEPIKPKWWGA
jgi:hypothetical protein